MDNSSFTIEKMLLTATLKANLDTLKVYAPGVYQQFKDYTPENTWVVIDDDGNPNLFNNDNYVYQEKASEFCRKQVSEFMILPNVVNLDMPVEPEQAALYQHASLLDELYKKRHKDNPVNTRHPIDEDRLDLVLMLGVGLGYQIEELFKLKKVQSILLCEPSPDVFYAMLHCIELRTIIERCKELGGTVSFTIGSDAVNPIRALEKFFRTHGYGYLARVYLYKHYDATTNDESVEKLQQLGYRLAFAWGFMEDEVIGFRHTLANIKAGHKIAKKRASITNYSAQRPVFIAANGPSIDYCMEFLQENQDDIIIISCGTTLKALLKNNITPDIHIEMERPKSLIGYIEDVENQQENSSVKLKDIQLVALNTVHPKVLEKFKTPLLLTKSADAGGVFVKSMDEMDLYEVFTFANPTCVNSAMELTTLLGFKEIYLLGTDFGYVSKDKHHSKDSVYYEEDYANKEVYDAQMTTKLSRKGNFRETILTNNIYDSTRINIEFLLSQYTDLNVYNTADGAFIQLTKPKKIEDIQLLAPQESKKDLLNSLLNDAFDNKQLEMKAVEESVHKIIYIFKVTLEQLILKMNKPVNSREELADIFSEQFNLLKELYKRDEYKFSFWMIQGTFRYYQSMIMTHSYYYSDLDERNDFMNFCLEKFTGHLEFLYNYLVTTHNKVEH